MGKHTSWMAMALALAACSSSTSSTHPTVTLGAILDVSGSIAAPSRFSAIKLAISDFNSALQQANGLQTDRFAGSYQDSTNDPKVAVPVAIALVQDAGCKALITDSSNDTNAVNYLAYDGGVALAVPIMGIEATSNNINNPAYVTPDGGDPAQTLAYQNTQGWLFRTSAVQTPEASVMIRIVQGYSAKGDGDINGDGKFKVALFGTNEPFGAGFVNAWAAAATSAAIDGGAPLDLEKILMPFNIDTNAFNWADAAAWMDDSNNESSCSPCSASDCTCPGGGVGTPDVVPDAILPALYPQYVAALYKNLQPPTGTRVLNSHIFHFSSVLSALGPQANGAEGVSFIVAQTNASGTTFTSEMTASAGAPEMWDSQAYDAAALYMLATVYAAKANALDDISKVTGAMIKDGLRNVNQKGAGAQVVRVGPAEFTKAINYILAGTPIDYDGASGPCDFDANQNVLNQLTHFSVVGQEFVDGEIYDCVADPVKCPCVANGSHMCHTL